MIEDLGKQFVMLFSNKYVMLPLVAVVAAVYVVFGVVMWEHVFVIAALWIACSLLKRKYYLRTGLCAAWLFAVPASAGALAPTPPPPPPALETTACGLFVIESHAMQEECGEWEQAVANQAIRRCHNGIILAEIEVMIILGIPEPSAKILAAIALWYTLDMLEMDCRDAVEAARVCGIDVRHIEWALEKIDWIRQKIREFVEWFIRCLRRYWLKPECWFLPF